MPGFDNHARKTAVVMAGIGDGRSALTTGSVANFPKLTKPAFPRFLRFFPAGTAEMATAARDAVS